MLRILQGINEVTLTDLHSILSSIGALGWNTERARANSSNPKIPLCFVSNKSNTCVIKNYKSHKKFHMYKKHKNTKLPALLFCH